MKDILFRGKRIDNGEWLEGYYGFDDNKPLIAINKVNGINGYFVAAETVGQYTGLTDKNGKKIFEGDIYTWRDDYNDYHACLICFGKYFDGYANKYATMANGFYIKTLQGETFNFAGAGYSEIKISGNIYDNPELLEEQA